MRLGLRHAFSCERKLGPTTKPFRMDAFNVAVASKQDLRHGAQPIRLAPTLGAPILGADTGRRHLGRRYWAPTLGADTGQRALRYLVTDASAIRACKSSQQEHTDDQADAKAAAD